MVYKFEWRSTQYPVSAQQAGEYLQEISEKEGGVTAERLLELSRDENALMHPCFEWNDTKAAEKYRLDQSRRIINGLVTVKVQDEGAKKVRAFVSVTSTEHAERGVFKPLVSALSGEDERRIVLRNALRDLRFFKDKYEYLVELSKVFGVIDDVLIEYDQQTNMSNAHMADLEVAVEAIPSNQKKAI